VKKVYVFLLILALINLTFGFSSKVFASDYINVILSPNTANTQNAITIQLKFDSNIYIGQGTQIEIGFDEASDQSTKMNIPSSISSSNVKIQYGSVTYASQSAQISMAYVTGGMAYRLKFWTSNNTPQINPGNYFSIIIDKEANIYPKTSGSHSLFVVVGNATVSATYTVGTSTSTGITLSLVSVDNPKLGAASKYTFNFYASQYLTSGDKIYMQFPTGFTMPTTIDGDNIGLVQGSIKIDTFKNNVSVSGNTVTVTIPSTAYTFTGGSLLFGPYTGIYNPSTAGNYTFSMWTSKQTTPASYTVTLGTKIASFTVSVTPLSENAIGDYTATFYTSATGALSTTDTITIVFPDKFVIPTQIPQGGILVNNSIAKFTVSRNSLIINVPSSINNSSQVKVRITPDAKIKNPPASTTGYKIKLYTNQDQYPVESPAIVFTPSTVQNVKASVSPAVISKSASYTVNFTLGSGGALSSGDTIYVTFPLGTMLPTQISASISASSVSIKVVNTSKIYMSASVMVTLSTKTVSIALPQVSIDANSEIVVTFDASANIVNPSTAGQLKLKVSTSKEATPVESDVFEIFANPVSSLVVTLQNPDGTSGYYITQPSFTISVKEILGTTITAYYKMGDSDIYKTYDLVKKPSITIPEGKTTVYFYAVDNFGNKEPENSKTFLVDLTDPIITISTPTENSVIVQPTYTLKGSIKVMDVSGAALTIDGKAVQINSDGSFETLVSVPKEGVYTTIIKVTSPSGRTATKQFSVNYIARVTIFLQIGNDKAYINGEQIAIDALPFISGGNVMVPLRFILTSFKANLNWDGIFQIINLTLGSNSMRLQIGNLRADVNGQLKMLPTPPVLVKGVTFVPLRFISENFGADVKWDGTLKAVSIIYPKP